MAPALASSAARTSLAVVVLPQPDSPTRPSVSPLLMVKLMPSTALTQPWALPNIECPTAKYFFRSRTSNNGSPTRGLLDGQPTPHAGPVAHVLLARFLGTTAFHHVPAAGMKSTAGGRVGKVRGLARDDVQRLLGAELRYRVQQRPSVGMLGVVEQAAHRLHLHDLARVHHCDLVAHLGHDPQVVGDEDEGHPGRTLQVLQQIQVLELDGHVEIGGGLV